MSNTEAPKRPTGEQRLMAELEAQRNQALTQAAVVGAELTATRDALADSEARCTDLQTKLDDALKNRAQRRAK